MGPFLLLVVALVTVPGLVCTGGSVKVDLLGGIGDFEYSSDTAWNSGYSASDAFFADEGGWYSAANAGGWRYGFRPASTDDAVATGWVRQTGEQIDPTKQIVYRIVDSGIGGSRRQYFALRSLTGYSAANLAATLRVGSKASDLRVGDQVTFRVDHILTSDYSQAASFRCLLRLSWTRWSAADSSKLETVEKDVVVSPGESATSASVSGKIDSGATSVSLIIRIEANGVGAHSPGVYVDGAHLWVQRAGETEFQTESVPYPRSRSIKTFKVFLDSDEDDIRAIASDYDYAMFRKEEDYNYVPGLKYLNPAIRLYHYAFCGVSDGRDSRGIDTYFSNTPLGFGLVSRDHPSWLYANGEGGYVTCEGATSTYYATVADTAYSTLWADTASRTASARHFDGIWMDGVSEATALSSGTKLIRPKQEPWEMQSFLHTTVPILRSRGLDALQNASMKSPANGVGRVYLDPFWTRRAPYDSANYSTNSPGQCPNAFCQEWSFFVYDSGQQRNSYSRDYWKSTIDDMDVIRDWNSATGPSALASDQKRAMLVHVLGTDRADDPAYGSGGWLIFGLCSYLLGQSDWTMFGCGIRPSHRATLDYSPTKRLGVPDGDHQPYNGDQYFRYRRYKATSDGGIGGVVIVNGNTDGPRDYILGFNALDESGNFLASGTKVTLPAHTGRMLFRADGALEISVQVSSQAVAPGQAVDVTLQYRNIGSLEIRNLALRAVVPEGMVYKSGSAEASGGSFNSVTNEVSWIIDVVGVGLSGSRVFRATVQ